MRVPILSWPEYKESFPGSSSLFTYGKIPYMIQSIFCFIASVFFYSIIVFTSRMLLVYTEYPISMSSVCLVQNHVRSNTSYCINLHTL